MREELLLRDKEVEVFTEIETERDDLATLVDQLSKELRSVREQSTDAARRAREAKTAMAVAGGPVLPDVDHWGTPFPSAARVMEGDSEEEVPSVARPPSSPQSGPGATYVGASCGRDRALPPSSGLGSPSGAAPPTVQMWSPIQGPPKRTVSQFGSLYGGVGTRGVSCDTNTVSRVTTAESPTRASPASFPSGNAASRTRRDCIL